jgi:hypothetical protein
MATATVTDLGLATELDLDAEFDLAADLDLAAGPDLDARPVTSYLDAKPPHRLRSPRPTPHGRTPHGRTPRGRPGAGRPRRERGLGRRVALPMLALLVVAGLVLTAVTVGLVNLGLATATGNFAAATPLVVPAPAVAGGLPRHYQPVTSTVTQGLFTEFVQRFTAISGSYSGQPTGLYREPGTIDLATDDPGWVMYLGYNSATALRAPSATITQLMADLTGSSAPGSSWPVAPGPRGGSARCAIASFGGTMVSLCAWATGRTMGALMSPTSDTRGKELAVLMPRMRLDLQPG